MGGTNILSPLKYIYTAESSGDRPMFLFLLTDGAVDDPNDVVDLVREHSGKSTVHAIGIGSGASSYLILNTAKAGQGLAEFIQDNEPI
jgi:hypothetical protein